MYYPDFKHMMQRYLGKDDWNTRTADNTVFSPGIDALRTASDSPRHRQVRTPNAAELDANHCRSSDFADLRRVHDQHVVYLGGPLAVNEWTDDLRQSMAEFAACARTEFNIEDDLFRGLLRS